MDELEALYLSSNTNHVAQQWNEQRRMILRAALNEYIVPALERELKVSIYRCSFFSASFVLLCCVCVLFC